MSKKKEASEAVEQPKYPGVAAAMAGSDAVVAMETAASEAAGAYPITPSTDMGEGWADAVAQGKKNVNDRHLLFFEPEGEHAAAAVTAGMSMVGLRSTNFSAGQGIAYMHESLYAAVGKRLTYVLNVACRAMTKQSLNIHCGHDDFHAVDDTGFFQLFAKNVQQAADFNLIAHRIAELSLNPGISAMDGFLTSHVIETLQLPERDLVKEYLGDPSDIIECPTPAQKMVFGETRRRIPELYDFDYPAMLGTVQNQDSYAQGVAAQRPFYFDHIAALADQAFAEFATLTGRNYARAMGYRMDDAEYVLVGLGSFLWNAEAVADHLRKESGLKVGVLQPVMFRPFAGDQIAQLLKGKKAVTVFERLDQPLASDAPLLREIQSTLLKGLENHTNTKTPYPDLPAISAKEMPAFYGSNYGMGSRDLQPGDIIAAVENMLPDGTDRRRFYLGVDFVRKGELHPSLKIAQDKLLQAYPKIEEQSIKPAENVNLQPEGALALRIHSVGGWGAITTGKNLALLMFDLLGMHVKANPKYGSEKKGQPTTFFAVLAKEAVRLNGNLNFIDVSLSPDPNVFLHSNPLAGLPEGGAFVIQTEHKGQDLWNVFPDWAQELIRRKKIKVAYLDAFAIARAEATDADMQFRMQGAAFQGAFFATSPLLERENMKESELFDAIRGQLEKKFGSKGAHIVEDNFRVIRRGFDEVHHLDYSKLEDYQDESESRKFGEDIDTLGYANADRFNEDVTGGYQRGDDPIADPFIAVSAIPAATGVLRDMTAIRFEIPKFIPENCTGCAACWTQCPDSAIPGLVVEVDALLQTAIERNLDGVIPPALQKVLGPVTDEIRRNLKEADYQDFGKSAAKSYARVVPELGLTSEEREEATTSFEKIIGDLSIFPVARTNPYFTVPEMKEEGSGGLLAVTLNPYACKGCMLCVEVCPDEALIIVKQDEDAIMELRHNWDIWKDLPDTPDRFVQVRDYEEGIGVLSTLMLKKDAYESMVGGDGACMGCGEKTALHLITSTIEASIQHYVADFVKKIEELTHGVNQKLGEILASVTSIENVPADGQFQVDVKLPADKKAVADRLVALREGLRDLHWRYTSGPTGKGRAALGMANSTGCSSVWASTFPFNPYPYPWVNHLFQDAPSIAIGIFEGHMRKMADAFTLVRKAELEVDDTWNPEVHPDYFDKFDWQQFTDGELALCPPIVATGGDGAMLDIGFQNLSRLLASDKPIRVVVLDTQVYSNTGGQACTSGFTGQVSDMATFGQAQHGKTEVRKELGLLAIAHRGAFVLQSSQATPNHLIAGVLKGLRHRGPAIFNIYTPCQTEHGVADDASLIASRLALESRAFPNFIYDPAKGATTSDRLDLESNPDRDQTWPAYELSYVDDTGSQKTMEVPISTAQWAASERRFIKHFKIISGVEQDESMVVFEEYIALSAEDRKAKTPYIYAVNGAKKLVTMAVSDEMVTLADERIEHWITLREMAGEVPAPRIADRVRAEIEKEFADKFTSLEEEYNVKLADLEANYTRIVTDRIVSAVLGTPAENAGLPVPTSGGQAAPATPAAADEKSEADEPAVEAAPEAEEETGASAESYIDSFLCTTCNDCINRNGKMFVYNSAKQAEIGDLSAGTYRELVLSAEGCPVGIIHPGDPWDESEPNLDEWKKRAEPFR